MDPTEDIRRDLTATINEAASAHTEETLRQKLEETFPGDVYNTDELRQNFAVESFMAPWVVVTRLSDGARGTLEFSHNPRLYYNFVKE